MKPSRPSRRSAKGSWTSASPGSSGLGRAALKDLAARYGIHPSKALGQSFLADPNLARAIVADAGIGEGDRVLEVGPGLGSLTVALAATGATCWRWNSTGRSFRPCGRSWPPTP